MFHIKICGVRLKCDIDAVARSRADAIGLNFFPPSVRYVDPNDRATLELSRHACEAGLIRVGVFVNETAGMIAQVASRLGFHHVQLHGDEPVEVAIDLISQGLSVIRAIKLPAKATPGSSIADRSADWIAEGCMLLIDADAGAAHGGGGKTLDWNSISQWSRIHPNVPWALAGGLTVDNVSQAITASGAAAVDVASGVEHPRGKKSGRLIDRFAELANQSFA